MRKLGRIIVIGIGGTICLYGCEQKKTPPPPPTAVNLYTVKAQPVVYYDRFPATTVALSQVDLIPQVQGYVTGIFFKEGTHVRKGQKLYEIDRRTFEANYKAAEDNLKVAEGNLTQSQQDADRYTYLNNVNAVAKQLYDHAVIGLQNAKSQYKAAAESLRNARINLNFSEITAPFDGTIGFSQVKMGNLVVAGQTVLNTISTDDPMGVDFLINEKQLNYFERLQQGMDASVDSLFTLVLPNNSYYPYPGKLSVVDRSVDPQTGSLRIRLVFPSPNYELRAGMSCVVRVHNQDSIPQIVIPNKAIVEQMGEYFIYVVRDTTLPSKDSGAKKGDSNPEGRQGLYAFQKKVIPGEVIGPNIIIKSGLTEGERVVTDGVQALHDGSRVSVGAPGGAGGKKPDGSGQQTATGNNTGGNSAGNSTTGGK
jgi:membrane fusion protein, multidrug efflux system